MALTTLRKAACAALLCAALAPVAFGFGWWKPSKPPAAADKGPGVAGAVTDAETGKPLKSFAVFVVPLPGPGKPVEFPKAAKGEGRYEVPFSDLKSLLAGENGAQPSGTTEFALRIEAYGYRPAASPVFHPDKPLAMNLKLSKWPAPTGQVINADGSPAGRAVVWYMEPSPVGIVWVQDAAPKATSDWEDETDGSGHFRFKLRPERPSFWSKLPMFGPPPSVVPLFDPYMLFISSAKGYAVASEDDFFKGEPIIRLTPWGRITGTALSGANPSRKEKIALTGPSSPSPEGIRVQPLSVVTTDDKGRFTIERVPEGTWLVGRQVLTQPDGPPMTSHATTVTVEAGATERITIGGIGRAVVGRVEVGREAGKRPAACTAVTLELVLGPSPEEEAARLGEKERSAKAAQLSIDRELRERSYAALVGKDASFRIEDVPPGQYVMKASLEGASVHSAACGQAIVLAVPPGRGNEPVDLGVVKVSPEAPHGGCETAPGRPAPER